MTSLAHANAMPAQVGTRPSVGTDADVLAQARSHYLQEYGRVAASLPGANLGFVAESRRRALAAFERLGFPTTRNEDWKYTGLAPLAAVAFSGADDALATSVPGAGSKVGATVELAARFGASSTTAHTLATASVAKHRLVFINGHFDPAASSVGELPLGLRVLSLSRALSECPEVVKAAFASTDFARDGDYAFVALNGALFSDGAVIVAEQGIECCDPIHLVFIGTPAPQADPVANHLRNLLVLRPSSRLTVVEHFVSMVGASFTNSVTYAALGQGAALAHAKVQDECLQAFHMGHFYARQECDSRLSAHLVAMGGRLARSETHVELAGEGSECKLDGLYACGEGQLVDSFTTVVHAVPHCSSRETYKGILQQGARAVWTGRIRVEKDAQKTSSQQTNKNLLLCETGQIESRPQLEIYADDVKCSHGAAIGRLDEDACSIFARAVFLVRRRSVC